MGYFRGYPVTVRDGGFNRPAGDTDIIAGLK